MTSLKARVVEADGVGFEAWSVAGLLGVLTFFTLSCCTTMYIDLSLRASFSAIHVGEEQRQFLIEFESGFLWGCSANNYARRLNL